MAKFGIYAHDYRQAREHLKVLERHIPSRDWVYIGPTFYPHSALSGRYDFPVFAFVEDMAKVSKSLRALRQAHAVGSIRLFYTNDQLFLKEYEKCLT